MTTPITFTKIGDIWVAELKVSGAFALHIERAEAASVRLFQRTVEEGGFAPMVGAPDVLRVLPVIDTEIGGEIFPKWVRIELGGEPSGASVTSEEAVEVLPVSGPEIKFYVNDLEYTASDGMTWAEFCESGYNSGGGDWTDPTMYFENMGSSIYGSAGLGGGGGSGTVYNPSGSAVRPEDTIQGGAQYYTE